MHAALMRSIDPLGGNPQLCDEAVKAMWAQVKKGNINAFKELTDRLDGRVPYDHKTDDQRGPQIAVIITGVPRPGRDQPEQQPKVIEHQPNATTNKD